VIPTFNSSFWEGISIVIRDGSGGAVECAFAGVTGGEKLRIQ
jgi:hypothetical protein